MKAIIKYYTTVTFVFLISASSSIYAQKDENKTIIEQADILLESDAFSVVNKTGIPPSKDKHDYMSIGPYWWPDPTTNDGLPYVRKDGKINPEARNKFTDYVEKKNFVTAVKTLTKAYNKSNKKQYARKNVALITAWFLDADTKMNPNMNYGQYVPGKSKGRCFGVIEFEGIVEVLKFLELAKHRNILDKKTEEGMFTWLTEYANWLKNSDLGVEESTRENNHGTHYDVQLLNILMYLNRDDEVKAYIEKTTKPRIYNQIEPDGSQPRELARTKSFSYSVMNLHGFLELAKLGEKVGVPLWEFVSKDGISIKNGYQYLLPYLTSEKIWEHEQISDKTHSEEKLISDMKYVSKVFKDDTFDKALDLIAQRNTTKH